MKFKVLFALVSFLFVAGCGPKVIQTEARGSKTFSDFLVITQDSVEQARGTGDLAVETADAAEALFEKLATCGLKVNVALRAGNNADALTQVQAGLDLIQGFLDVDLPKLPTKGKSIAAAILGGLKTALQTYKTTIGGV